MVRNNKIENILVFTNTLEKGGAEMQAVELSKVLSERHRIYLAVFYGKQINPELLARLDGYQIQVVYMSGSKLKCVFELRSLIKECSIDCIYSFLATTNFYAAVVGRLCGVKYILGGIRSSNYAGIKLLVQRFLHNTLFTCTISNNNSAVSILAKCGFKESKFEVVHNVFPKPVGEFVRSKRDVLTIITVGRFVPAKDYETALRAIATLRTKQSVIPFKFVIIGYGELEAQIRRWIDELKLTDIVEVKINPNNIFENLVNADIYLSTSLFEGTSNSILEAMYAQLPVVATNVGDNSYMVKEENGFLTEIKDVETIADKLSFLLNNKEIRKKMSAASKEIVETRFSQEAFAKKNFELLEKLQK